MEGRYARLYHATVVHRKFRRMPLATRGAWALIVVHADMLYPATLDRDTMVGIVEDNGASLAEAHAILNDLIVRGLLDVTDDGIEVHDHDEMHVAPSNAPEATRARKRLQRERERAVTNDPRETPAPETFYPGVNDEHDALDRYYELTMSRPWGRKSGEWLKAMQSEFGTPTTIAALEIEAVADVDRRSLLTRVEARLSRDRDKAGERATFEAERALRVRDERLTKARQIERAVRSDPGLIDLLSPEDRELLAEVTA